MDHATPAKTESGEDRSQPMSKSAKKRQKQKAKKKVRDWPLSAVSVHNAFGYGLGPDRSPFSGAMLPSCSALTTSFPTHAQPP
jgi:hypothetical protein